MSGVERSGTQIAISYQALTVILSRLRLPVVLRAPLSFRTLYCISQVQRLSQLSGQPSALGFCFSLRSTSGVQSYLPVSTMSITSDQLIYRTVAIRHSRWEHSRP